MAVFKSVGAYVALDGLAIANAARPAAGAAGVVVVGDDPALSSTQVGADSRLTLAGARIPVLEPASAQELKDLVRLAFDLSAESELIVGLVVHHRRRPTAPASSSCCPTARRRSGPRSRVALDTAAIRAADAGLAAPARDGASRPTSSSGGSPLLHAAVRAAGLDRHRAAAGAGAAPPRHRDRRRLLRPAARRARRAGDRRRGADPAPGAHLAGRRRAWCGASPTASTRSW